ncbi:MAG: 2,3-bisphosphoglycerate-independent phosphoglycerate mutase [Campylobacterales bacterium]|nr:2,3-bisphosphoglycerate-independent phosphoglycerate mutase [Campylobacterales bacterium]
MSKKAILIINDGIGIKPKGEYNAFLNAKTPTFDKLFKEVPNSAVSTHGLAVGLPDGQMGNSEVGHMTIGSGRVSYQDLVKVFKAVEEDTLKDNEALKCLIKDSKRVHIFGLISDGGVHSHIDHILALIELASKQKEVFIHVITDGRDVSPTSAKEYIAKLQDSLNDSCHIATISGRYYGMDRDNRWERVEQAYNPIVNGSNPTDLEILDYIDSNYKEDITDEFIKPASIKGYEGTKDGDGFIFANFRSDRVREMSQLIGDKEFMPVEVTKKDVNLITMTEYSKEFSFPIMFKKEKPKNTLAEVISNAGLTQFHTAETEKYAHVTFFFNGGIEEPFTGESRVLIPSPKVDTYDEKPEMSAEEVGNAVVTAVKEGYDFIVVNFANGDMVGHTGVYEAGLKAVETVDSNMKKILDEAEKEGYGVLITADHGNCEEMKDGDGNVLTNHTVGDVYCFLKQDGVEKIKDGGLNNIAPTILKMMELDIPKEMDEPLF